MAAPSPAPDLTEGYYLDNVEQILGTVARRDADLLDERESAFLRDFPLLPLPARRLWVRLLSRRGPVFRRDLLAYPEIPDLDGAVADLVAAGFLDAAPDLPPRTALARVRLAEAADLASELLDPPLPRRKGDLVKLLVARREPEDLAGALRRRWSWLAPLRTAEMDTFRLLFFGNLRQDWTEFVLRDLRVLRYEAVPLDRSTRLLPDRGALESALAAHRAREAQLAAREADRPAEVVAIGGEVLARADWHPAVRPLVDRILLRAGRTAERLGDAEAALAFYRRSRVPPARERRARVLDRLGRDDAALALADRIARAPRDETEARFGPRFAHGLRRRRDPAVPALPRPRRPRLRLELPRTAPGSDSGPGSPTAGLPPGSDPAARDPASVETRVLEHLAAEGREGLFAENWLWTSLFGLAFWDVVFAPIPGAFLHPFQVGPLDLSDPDFHSRRRDRIEERLAELRGLDDLGPRLLPVWDEKRGTANPFVAWSDAARSGIEIALRRVRGPSLALVAGRLARAPRRYRRGLPDLLVASPEPPGFELWEVKGPGDQLRPEQTAWIDWLGAHGIPARVVDVRWTARDRAGSGSTPRRRAGTP